MLADVHRAAGQEAAARDAISTAAQLFEVKGTLPDSPQPVPYPNKHAAAPHHDGSRFGFQ